MAPIKFYMYNITSRRVTKSDLTARLGSPKGKKEKGEVRKATVHKVQIVEEPRAAHDRNDDRHDQLGRYQPTTSNWELLTKEGVTGDH